MFQISGFQVSGYQAGRVTGVTPESDELLGGKDYSYTTPFQKFKEEEYQRKKIEAEKAKLAKIDDEIAEAEAKRLAELAKLRAKKLAAKKRAALEAIQLKLLEEINLLRIQRTELMQRINEEESILVILLMARRRRFRVV